MSRRANKNILVPLDGSPLAEAALPHAVTLAKATASGLILLQVVQSFTSVPYLDGLPEVAPEAFEAYEVEGAVARRYLRDVAERLGSSRLPMEERVIEGDPADTIIECAEDRTNHVSGIVMCTHGRTGADRLLSGSVAQELLRTSPVPLLIIHRDLEKLSPPADLHYRTLLVPLDGSPTAEQALCHARDLAQGLGARLVLLSVVQSPLEFKIVKEGSSEWSAVPWDSPATQAAEYLGGITQRLAASGLCVEAQVTHGEITSEILRAAKSVKADMIVMATTRSDHRGLEHLVAGSTAERVTQMARVAVLLIRVKGSQERQPEVSSH